MTAIHVAVTAGDLETPFDPIVAWARPVELALKRLTAQEVDISGDTGGGNLASIGDGAWCLVVELPDDANRWLNRRWEDETVESEPFAFDLEVPGWVVALVARAASTDEQAAAVQAMPDWPAP